MKATVIPMNPTQTVLAKIEQAPQTLRDIVQERMREAIISGHFPPGARLVERALCDQLGVSRTVIRETIRYLEAEGLVENQPNRGPTVATLTWDQAKQIYGIRLQLEGSAASACAQRRDPAFDRALTQALNTLGRTMEDTEWADLLRATTGFYQLIFEQARHDIAWDIVQRLNGRISRLRALTLGARNRARPGMAHMQAIHDAILSGDGEAARAAVAHHIADAEATAAQFLDTLSPEPADG